MSIDFPDFWRFQQFLTDPYYLMFLIHPAVGGKKVDMLLLFEGVEQSQTINHATTRVDGALHGVFVRDWISKTDQRPVSVSCTTVPPISRQTLRQSA